MRFRSKTGVAIMALLVAAVAVAASLLLAWRTGFLQNKMRSRIVSALERSSGGRIELRAFDFDLPTLTARLDGLVIHGVEAAGNPPLVSVRSLAIKLQITSFVRRTLGIVSLDVEQPEIYLLFRRDGSTNLPSSSNSSDWLQKVLDFRVEHFAARHGTLEINQSKHRFDLTGRELRLAGHYDAAQAAYRLSLASGQTLLQADCCKPIAGSLSSQATLRHDSLDVERFTWSQNRSMLNVQGLLTHFAQPTASFRFQAALDGQDLRNELPLDDLDVETVAVDGRGHFDVPNGLNFKGRLSARHLRFASRNVTLRNADASSVLEYRKDELHLSDLLVSGLGGTFRGTGTLFHTQEFALEGNASNIEASQVVAATHHSALAWNARLSGSISLRSPLPATYKALAFRSDLAIVPFSGETPLAGKLRASKARADDLQFGDSYLALPGSRLSFQGSWKSGINLDLVSSNPRGLGPAAALPSASNLRDVLDSAAQIKVSATATGSYRQPQIAGSLAIDHFEAGGQPWDQLRANGSVNAQALTITSSTLEAKFAAASLSGAFGLSGWAITPASPVRLQVAFHRVSLPALPVPHSAITAGLASGNLNLAGSLDNPSGAGRLILENTAIYNQQFARVEANLQLADHRLQVRNGHVRGPQSGAASFSGVLTHVNDWRSGELSLDVDTTAYPVASLNILHNRYPDLHGSLDARANFTVDLRENGIRPLLANGNFTLRDVVFRNLALGQITARFSTEAARLHLSLSSNLPASILTGEATVALAPGSPIEGRLRFDRTDLAPLISLLTPESAQRLPIDGSVSGEASISGSLENLSGLSAEITLEQLAINANKARSYVQLHNIAPVLLKTSDGTLAIAACRLAGRDTSLTLSGSAHYLQPRSLKLAVEGSADLQLLTLFDPNIESHGQSSLNATLDGPPDAPVIKGKMQIRDASLSLRDFASTALTGVNGAVLFDNGRATLDRLAGQVGGGEATLGGFVSFGPGGAFIYHLNAQTQNVRVRSPSNISVTANSSLRFTGTNASSLLAGTATITHVVFNPTTDVGNVLAGLSAPSPVPANQQSFISGLHLDVGIESAPTLQLSTALSRDVEAEIDLRLRGTPDRLALLGSVSANEGDIRIFGSRYTINRGEVRFVNPSKIDPVLDLDLQTQARGIQVDITVAGTLNRLNVTYRSDPPLQPRDIIALLTVGRTPQEAANTQTTQITNNATSLETGANTVLGQVIAQPPNRLSKLFGITNIKIDPLVQGITNTPQARLTLEQQVSRAITVTYVTNLSQTSEQIFRLEWSLNPQFSVVAVRDDNGEFGIDFQYKKRFK